MNLRFLQILTVLILLFHGKAMADESGKILDRLPETKEDLDLYEGMEIPYDEAVENIFQLRNMDDLYEDVKFRLLCRTYLNGRKYEIYNIDLKYYGYGRACKQMYLLMYEDGKKYPKALKISIADNVCRAHFYIKDNIIEINYIRYSPGGEFHILENEFYDLDNMKLIKTSLKKEYYTDKFVIGDDSEILYEDNTDR